MVQNRINLAKQKGCKTHIYLEGPKGPTAGVWLKSEKDRYEAARAQHPNWYTTGWWEYTKKEILKFQDHYSIEIDNVQRAHDIGWGGKGYQNFLTKYCEFKAEKERQTGKSMPKFTAKNVTEAQMRIVVAFAKNPSTQNCISEFAISEAGTDYVHTIAKGAGIAVYRAASRAETNNYQARIPRHESCQKAPARSLASEGAPRLTNSAQQEVSTR